MSDLISREDSIRAMLRLECEDIEAYGAKIPEGFDAEPAVKALKALPSVDAVPVVRCKDCKHYFFSNERCALIDTRLHFYETDKAWTSDCYCAWGERRNDETD